MLSLHPRPPRRERFMVFGLRTASRLSQEADDLGNLLWLSRAVLDRRSLELWFYNLRVDLIQHFGLNRPWVDLYKTSVHGRAILPKLSSPASRETFQSGLCGSGVLKHVIKMLGRDVLGELVGYDSRIVDQDINMRPEGFSCSVHNLLGSFWRFKIAFASAPFFERSLLYVIVNLAPRAAKSKAIASPMPRLAPVTMALFWGSAEFVLKPCGGR
ncbi:hypothetical protein KC330_g59 [Hortaea werneckii]|nr:hypothetical protein KC330_g59 [Hortaea werneckii]